jgi:L-asparaginase II
MPSSPPVDLLRVIRGEVLEATHEGHLVVADGAGKIAARLGDAGRVTYYRSCAKPFQAIAAVRTGIVSKFGLEPRHVAIMAASHNGERGHVEVVRDLLKRADVPEAALQCGAHWPYYEPYAAEVRHEMDKPLTVFNNCSGKHAGMLAAARALNAPLETYLDPDHPIQVRIKEVIAEFAGVHADSIELGIDGCSAPNAAVPLSAMARSFAALVTSKEEAAREVVDAMVENPWLVGGTGRFDTEVMQATAGRLLAKGGAAGAHTTANRATGQGLAVKLESGDGTWTSAAVVAALEQLGWLTNFELEKLAKFGQPVLKNHKGLEVGRVLSVLTL